MSREEQKQYNAINYPASVLKWLNEATDRAFNEFEDRTCETCACNIIFTCEILNSLPFGHEFSCNQWEEQ